MKKVFLHLAEGFEEVEALAAADILRRGGIDTVLVSVTGNKTVKGGHDIKVEADALFEEVDYGEADMLVLPGGGLGTQNLKAHQGLSEKLLEFNSQKKWLAAICAAPSVLGRLGLLKGKTAVCYPGVEEELEGAVIGIGPVEVSEHIITSRGVGTALEFGLKLVEVLSGSEKALSVRKSILA